MKLAFNITTQAWKKIPRLKAQLNKAAAAAEAHLPKSLQFPASANLLLATNAAVRRLNHDFRGIDKPTNVLSFPQYEPAALCGLRSSKHPVELGDIALAYQYIVVEAKKDNKILLNHITHLMIHGLLHLFGYDHLHDRDATRMERLEKQIMADLGLPDPYTHQHP